VPDLRFGPPALFPFLPCHILVFGSQLQLCRRVAEGMKGMKQLPMTGSGYESPPERVSLLARTFPSVAFFPVMGAIVWRCSALAKRDRYHGAEWSESSQEVVRALERVGVRFEITGLKHLKGLDGPCVFIANHMSVLETFALPGIIRPLRPVTFVVKEGLMTYPVFRHVMRSRDPIVVTRTNPREDFKAVMEGGKERLARGVSVVVFPQTTRTTSFDPDQFNTIGVKLAHRAGVPVVPLALLTDAWGNGKHFKDVGRIDPSRKVHFAFGQPFRVEGRGTGEHERIIAFIQGKLDEWLAARRSTPAN
jgi:1-acyl-sn-glycerol-3-phosphate acyltransferase